MQVLSRGDRIWHSQQTSSRTDRTKPKKTVRAAALPPFFQPMEAQLVVTPPEGDWVYELKFDGWRALALKGGSQIRLLSRNHKDFGAKFPIIMESLAALDAQDCVLDGEIVALDAEGRSSFQLLQAYDIGEAQPPLFFYAFDLLQLDGQDLKALPLIQRKSKLEKLLKNLNGVIRYSASLSNDAEPLLEKVRQLGLGGLIGKRGDSAYDPGGRNGSWVKLKLFQEQEFIIGGYTESEGTHFGSIIVGFYEDNQLIFAGKVGSGFNSRLLRKLHARFKKIARGSCPFANLPVSGVSKGGQSLTATEMKRCHWLEPQIVCQVKFSEWTQDNRLHQPLFLGLREDKDSVEVVRERISRANL
jgi:bifunctional non-homologous end joining protein LigD